MKNIDDICFIVQARLSSERVPRKMIKPFAGSNLVDIICKKINNSSIIPKANFYFSAYEDEDASNSITLLFITIVSLSF